MGWVIRNVLSLPSRYYWEKSARVFALFKGVLSTVKMAASAVKDSFLDHATQHFCLCYISGLLNYALGAVCARKSICANKLVDSRVYTCLHLCTLPSCPVCSGGFASQLTQCHRHSQCSMGTGSAPPPPSHAPLGQALRKGICAHGRAANRRAGVCGVGGCTVGGPSQPVLG